MNECVYHTSSTLHPTLHFHACFHFTPKNLLFVIPICYASNKTPGLGGFVCYPQYFPSGSYRHPQQ